MKKTNLELARECGAIITPSYELDGRVEPEDATLTPTQLDDFAERIRASQPDRHTLQVDGKHPAPCAKFCEATAFKSEIARLKSELEIERNRRWEGNRIDSEWYAEDMKAMRAEIAELKQALADIATTEMPGSNDEEHDALHDCIASAQGALAGISRI